MQSDTSRFPVILSTAELAFMLTLLKVPRLIGGDNAALFPQDAQSRDALLAEGKQQLEASGKLVWQPDLLSYHIDDVMVALLVPLGFPEIVVTCVFQLQPDIWQGVTYGLANQMVVEMVIIDGQYHLHAFAALDVIMVRLAEALTLPAVPHASQDIVVPRNTFEATRSREVPPEAVSLSDSASEPLIPILRDSMQDVMFSVFRVAQTEIVAVQFFGIIVDALGQAWMVTLEEPDHMRLCPTSRPAADKTLMHCVTALQTGS
jgi:hypothetical protein